MRNDRLISPLPAVSFGRSGTLFLKRKIPLSGCAAADEDGHLYEASSVKRFLRELRFLASQEACVSIHGVTVPCLAVLSRSSPNARKGCAFGRKGLTEKARAER